SAEGAGGGAAILRRADQPADRRPAQRVAAHRRTRLDLGAGVAARPDRAGGNAVSPEHWSKIEEIFHGALERTAGGRQDFIASACAADPSMAVTVRGLVADHERAGSFLEPPDSPPQQPPTQGKRVGSYTIVRPIAAGGMGAVFEAVQDRTRRRVALKLV